MIKTVRLSVLLFTLVCTASAQTISDINKTDSLGRKQGPWTKYWPNGNIQYQGLFRDDHPVGSFKRYYSNRVLMSEQEFSEDGREAVTINYHANGYISSKGTYINQMKEGKWSFFSATLEGYLINEEEYSKNMKNGVSIKYYPNGVIAEKLIFVNNVREGEWTQYHSSGNPFIKSTYNQGRLEGKFEVWFENGQIQYSGNYRNNLREGKWLIYNDNGSLKYELNYKDGLAKEKQPDLDFSRLIDSMEQQKDQVNDPEKTGVLR
jgi:antitoxin component YwqK of YwqJK toxin-antitoxin module